MENKEQLRNDILHACAVHLETVIESTYWGKPSSRKIIENIANAHYGKKM